MQNKDKKTNEPETKKVKAKKDLTADDAQKINEYLTLVSGDFGNNIGTMSIIVKDIMNNSGSN